MNKLLALLLVLSTFLTMLPASAEVNINGFGSVVVGRVTEGDAFLADYPKTGVYDKDWSASPDSSLGIQLSAYLTDDFSIIAQVVANSASESTLDIDWLYLSYQFTPSLSAQLGRKRLPLYYYSDYFDVGYAYYWIRPPADLYTWQISSYNGASLLYETGIGDWDSSISLYYGNEQSDDNELLGHLFGVPVDENWNDMIGGVGTLANAWLELRLSYMEGLVDRKINGVTVIRDISQQFIGLSVNLTLDDLQVLSELNRYERPDNQTRFDTYMLSLGYQLGDLTPHITRSSFEQRANPAGNDERHHTTSVGVRWDFYKDMALKLQYDKVVDEGVVVPIGGNAKAISFGLDFIF